MVSKSSEFLVCPLILRSVCICLRRNFSNQQIALFTATVHYNISTCVLQCNYLFILNFLVSDTYAQHSRATVVRLYFIVNWHVSIQISLEISVSWKLLDYWREFLLKICFEMLENERRKGKFSW